MSLLPFWALKVVIVLLSMGGIRKLLDFIKNNDEDNKIFTKILICVPKMNEGLIGLERHESE